MVFLLACTSPVVDTSPSDSGEHEVEVVGEVPTDTADAGEDPHVEARAAFFEPTVVQPIYLTLDENAQNALRVDGTEYVSGDFTHGDLTVSNVGVRIKGSSTLMPWDEKPSIKVRMDEFEDDQTYLGLQRVTLNNMIQDESQVAEVFGYTMLQRAGQIASRAGFAEVFVGTGDGSWESFGLYANVESVDGPFLDHHGLERGNLWEADLADFTDELVPDFELQWGTDDRSVLQGVADALDADPALDATADLVDTDQFLSFWAWSIAMANSDGYPYSENDYYVHEHASDGRLVFVPWGLDESWNRGSEFAEVEGRLGLVCLDDYSCRLAISERVEEVLQEFDTLDPVPLLHELYAITATTMKQDTRRPYDIDVVQDEREEMENDIDGWPDELRGQMADTLYAGELEACERTAQTLVLTGDQSGDATWCPQDDITLHGPVVFPEGTHLVIDAGTVLRGTWDADDEPGTLVVRGTVEAIGTADDPIVLEALQGDDEPAEFEGLKVYGDAPGATNPDGDAAHDSGTLRYVRVDGGGVDDAAIHFVNLGSGTTIEYVGSVSSQDDGFEFDGGTVEASHLVVHKCRDDGFQLEDGFTGTVRVGLSNKCNGSGLTIRNRDPDDSYDDESYATAAQVANVSLISNYSEGIYFDEGGAGTFVNLLVAEHSNCGTRIDDDSALGGKGLIDVNHLLIWDTDETWCESDEGWTLASFVSDLIEEDPLLDDWMPDDDSPAREVDNADTSWANFVGGFDGTDWTEGWIEEPD